MSPSSETSKLSARFGMTFRSASTVTMLSWTFWSTRPVEAVPVWWMSRFCVVSEWPQTSVPPVRGASCARARSGPRSVAPPMAAVLARKSLRFMSVSPVWS